jgi:sulfatase modifying factor 1
MSRGLTAVGVVSGWVALSLAAACRADDAPPPKKVALLVGVNQYLKPGFRALRFAEADVTAVGAELKKLGFEVTLLLGSGQGEQQATKANIEAAARNMVAPLGERDIALVMLSGHGQQLHPDPNADPNNTDFDKFQSFYCPYDAVVNHPETQVSLSQLVDEILAPNVGRRLLIVDACRDVPTDRSRGRNTKGIEGRVVTLPEDTAIFFSCRAGQVSFENDDLGHGLFTYCLLEGLRGAAVSPEGELPWSSLVAHVDRRMQQPDVVKYMRGGVRQVPIPAGALSYTVLGKLEVRSPAGQPAVPTPTPTPTPGTSGQPDGELEGKQAGEVRSFTDLGVKFCWCPAGSFTMGSPASEERRLDNEAQVPVTLSSGFWLGQTEVTQGLWESVMGTTPWSGNSYVKEGASYPATYVSHGLGSDGTVQPDSATEFCRKLTARERAAGRLPSGWSYQLPTEAQWEYACRAGTTGPYNGDGTGVLSDYAWYEKNAWDIGEMYAHLVGQKKPNRWGLLDMHGNVLEWCQDWYGEKLPGGRDPLVSSGGSLRVVRGGCWSISARFCRSAYRAWFVPSDRSSGLGFRLALSPSGE